jgi:hypothetical protein
MNLRSHLLLFVLMKFWCNIIEDGDNAETCRSSEIEIYIWNVQLCVCWCHRSFKVKFLMICDENCTVLVQYAQYTGNSLPTFQDNKSVPSSREKILTLENCTDRLSRNFGKELQLHAV